MVSPFKTFLIVTLLVVFSNPSPAASLCDSPDAKQRSHEHTFSGEPLDILPEADEEVTEEVRKFHCSLRNPYRGSPEAIAGGAGLFRENCAICHGVDAKGRMGPSLLTSNFLYGKNTTDMGFFETVWGGAAAAMAPLRGRLSQDQILRVMAYLSSLRER